MAAAVAAPLAAGSEEAASPTSVPGSLGLPGSRSAERALEEAVATGTLNLSNRRLKHFPRGAARSYDLSDITQADLSRNRFPEVPEAACQLVSLEGLSLYHNCLRCLNPALGNLTALTYLNLSRNQLSLLPSYICQLPLRVLIVSNNKLGALPPDISALGSLRQLDVSSNELQCLPTELCSLPSLRDLNVRRNQLSTLPDELGDLPLVRLDFSCNRVSRIPVSFCRLRHLQVILLDSNPLQSPPAQICLKGKLHIFKYLSTEAGRRGGSALGDLAPSRPPSFSPCPGEDIFPGRRYDGGLDSGFHSVDSGSKRWSGNESTDEFSELSFRISELAREPRGPRERREDGSADGDPEQIDFIDSHLPGEVEERGAAEEQQPPALSPVAGDGEKAPSSRREEPTGEERRRPDTLQLWQERERKQQQQQQQAGVWGAPKKDSFLKLGIRAAGGVAAASSAQSTYNGMPKPSATQLAASGGQGAPAPAPTSQEPLPGPATAPAPRPLGSIQRPNSFLFRSSSQSGSGPSSPDSVLKPRRHPQLLDEKELTAQLRQALESRLQQPLPEDLAEALANGVILCQLANQLRPRSVPFIHVPSPAVPKLSALKSRKNVESFLEACRKMGVPEADLCSPSDLLQGTAQGLWTTLEAVKRVGDRTPLPLWPPPGLGGFIFFYVVLMLLLYVVYTWLLGVPVPAPPHPGRGGGPRKGPPLHRCCCSCTAGKALGAEVGAQGPTQPGPQDHRRQTPGLCSLARTGEGGLGPGPVSWVHFYVCEFVCCKSGASWVLIPYTSGLCKSLPHTAALPPHRQGAPAGPPREYATRGPETLQAPASRRGSERRGMLPWPPGQWCAGAEQMPEEPNSSAGSDPEETWNSGEEAVREPSTPSQDSPQPRARNPSRTQRELLPQHPRGLAVQHSPGTSVPFSSHMAWEVAPSRMTQLAPWDPNYEAEAGAQLVWGPSCSSGASFSGRTLCHPSFWPLYEAASGRGLGPRAPAPGHQNREQVPRDAGTALFPFGQWNEGPPGYYSSSLSSPGFPVMCCEDVFLSDPLLPRGQQRVPLYLSEPPQQVMGSLKLLLPPPIMSPWVLPTPIAGCSTTWLSGPELIALTGLLQMSQGEPRPSSSAASGAPTPAAASPDPVSEPLGSSADCPHFTDPDLP
ncbi:Leucine-rich repeat and calponin homology domain-containing protein 4 [Galemys pyrenaicus]|uniref:Leucine-rich repeat and calponin homology domain-containing protein 4 n=1 Tax=Galemys pyrenaicus TaxID=202257 RepID=A0A8J6BLR3_GALPY|nr:Leucine-rich repeat and calponin homology domain-containing protein 4 [Galemys pyrenaicus]